MGLLYHYVNGQRKSMLVVQMHLNTKLCLCPVHACVSCSQTIGDVETLLKQHGDLEKMLEVQEERLHNFNDHAERLVSVPSTADGEDDDGEAGSAAAIGEA